MMYYDELIYSKLCHGYYNGQLMYLAVEIVEMFWYYSYENK